MVREKNRMTVEEVRRLAAYEEMPWQEWERKFDGLLREGGWEWWRDRVVPAAPIRHLLYAHRVPKPVVEQVVGMVQRMGRKEGLPDRLIRKEFSNYLDASPELRDLVGPGVATRTPPVTVFGFVELKTGGATTTGAQDEWLEAAKLCPGMFSLVAHPLEIPYLRRVLGA